MGRKNWTAAEESKLAKLYPNTSNNVLAPLFDCTTLQISGKARKIGVKKTDAFMKVCNAKGNAKPQKGLALLLIDAVRSAGAAGVSVTEVVERFKYKRRTATATAARIAMDGKIFRGGFLGKLTYFSDREHAATFHAECLKASKARLTEVHRLRDLRRNKLRAAERGLVRATAAANKPAKVIVPKVSKRGHGWPADDIVTLRRDYPTMGVKCLPHRHLKAVQSMASTLGIRCTAKGLGGPKHNPSAQPKLEPARKTEKRDWPGHAQVAVSIPRPAPAKRGPAYLEGPVTYSPSFRKTVYPTSPAPLRSNTHSHF